ncbi:hypothetical protein SEA_TAYLORSIPHT_50 [Arthrobacter phage TaylorSipht]|nr:hypothetical protein SEA_TAYLORSIPHT_50 [Arthrobacter phage TaylorSipht]
MSGADNVTEVTDSGLALTLASFKGGASVLRELVEKTLERPGVALALALAGPEKRAEVLDELERGAVEHFEEHLQGHRSRLIAELDQKAAAK